MKGGDIMMNAISGTGSIGHMGMMNSGPMRRVQGGQGNDDLFSKVDTNQDGSLDESEVTSFSEKMAEMTGQSADAAQMMAMFDTDESGAVSESEFAAARPQGPPPPPMMGGMGGMGGEDPFSSVDEDGDGSLSESELTAFAEKMSEMTGGTVDAEELMTSLDADEDGAVSADEFKAGKPQGPPPPPPSGMGGISATDSSDETASMLSSLDTDGDGSVSEEEFKLGLNTLIQQYVNQSFASGGYSSSSGSVLSVAV